MSRTLANGKSWLELQHDASAAIKSGIPLWPDVCLQLLKRIHDLEAEAQALRQTDLFSTKTVRHG